MTSSAPMIVKPSVKAFFDEATSTFSYVVHEAGGSAAAIIDPVRDFDAPSGRTGTGAADELIAYVLGNGLTVEWILETHAHADHLSAAPYIKEKLGGTTAIGAHIVDVQAIFRNVFNLEAGFATDGSQFDQLFSDGDTFIIGALEARVMHTPGHTPACLTYVIGDCAFVGDTLFLPDYGTARCDFPGGDAGTLYDSIQRIYELPDETRLFMCHDYPPEGRGPQFETTVRAERTRNIHVADGTSREDFIAMREARDATLAVPKLLLPSIQVNIRAGALPPAEDNGVAYLKLPVDRI